MTEPTARRRWGQGASVVRPPHMSRAAVLAAREMACTVKTAAHRIVEVNHLAAAIVRAFCRLGDRDGLERFLRPIRQAEQGCPPAVTDQLVLDKVEADSEENTALSAFLLTKGAAERDTEIRRLRREAIAGIALADALEAEAI